MRRTVVATAVAAVGAALWLGWNYAHEETALRAPWTGAALIAAGAAFVLVGVVGRTPRALLPSVVMAVAAVLLVDPLVWHSNPIETEAEGCDPGCISTEAAAAGAAVASAALTTLGITLRRAIGIRTRLRDRRS